MALLDWSAFVLLRLLAAFVDRSTDTVPGWCAPPITSLARQSCPMRPGGTLALDESIPEPWSGTRSRREAHARGSGCNVVDLSAPEPMLELAPQMRFRRCLQLAQRLYHPTRRQLSAWTVSLSTFLRRSCFASGSKPCRQSSKGTGVLRSGGATQTRLLCETDCLKQQQSRL